MEAIEAENLTRDFGGFRAVDHISFKVSPGEFFGFLGPNGAGKTTTIRMLTGLSMPSEGRAKIMGHDVIHDKFLARECIGVVPDVSNIYDELSAWDNLMFAGKLYGVSRHDRIRRADELLHLFGLGGVKDKKVKGFSKGMKRKVTVAMALIHSPKVLFLDEPTAGLDVQGARTLKDILVWLGEEGTTIFLTTHTLDEANTLCDRVGIIVKGKLAAVEAPERLKRIVRMSRSVEVSLDSMTPRVIDSLASLSGVSSYRKSGDKIRLYTSEPSELSEAILDYARGNGRRIVSITTPGPTLEDTFLAIVNGNSEAVGDDRR